MADLLREFEEPAVMDIKMGIRTYLEEELRKQDLRPVSVWLVTHVICVYVCVWVVLEWNPPLYMCIYNGPTVCYSWLDVLFPLNSPELCPNLSKAY